jgi:hypothetical protein
MQATHGETTFSPIVIVPHSHSSALTCECGLGHQAGSVTLNKTLSLLTAVSALPDMHKRAPQSLQAPAPVAIVPTVSREQGSMPALVTMANCVLSALRATCDSAQLARCS